MQKAVLLHFLDKDMREGSCCMLTDKEIEYIVFVSLFMAPIIYAELTFEIESQEDIPHTIGYLKKLNNLNIVTAISCTNSIEELIVNRRDLYKFDEKRYPFYFKDDYKVFFPNNSLIIDSSTTEFIKEGLKSNHLLQDSLYYCRSEKDLLNYIVTQRLKFPNEKALTIHSFNKIFEDLENNMIDSTTVSSSKIVLSRELAKLHNKKYLESTFSSIIKNIPYMYIYDGIDMKSVYDFQIYYSILEPIFLTYNQAELEEKIIYWKSDAKFINVINRLYLLVNNLQNMFTQKIPSINSYALSKLIVNYINEKKSVWHYAGTYSTIEDLIWYLYTLEQKLQIKNRMEDNTNMYFEEKSISKNILLPVANMNEFKNIISICENTGFVLHKQVIGNNTFHIHIGNDFSLYIVKCEAGSLGPSASILTLSDAISKIDVDIIIFSGIAFGNYKKSKGEQRIGDILVSKQLWNYESGKINDKDEFIPRGDKCSSTPWLLDRFQNSAIEWEESNIHFGVIASGEKLVNSSSFVKKLMNQEPELIGGEMEGVGLISVAERYKKDWILVKGISDWGVGKTDTDQVIVARKTFRYVFQTIRDYF